MRYFIGLLLVTLLSMDASAQRGNESCWPEGVCIYEREQRRGRVDFMLENRSQRDAWVRIEMTDLYNYRSNKRLPVTTLVRAGQSTMAFRLTKSSPQEQSRKRRRGLMRFVPEMEPYCIDNVGCIYTEFEDSEIVYRFFNHSDVSREVEIELDSWDQLRKPKKGLNKVIPAGQDDIVGEVRINDVWGAWSARFRFTARPASE